ncbi:MAG: hypothetical protein AB8B65_16945 [Kordia sp.]|uniref:hypothetical protein n=1 Tax=Kordia sp. TaxID=1965332 RepID=UPI00385D95B5
MITLKDYIGKIYKEVNNAKVQSDIETLAIAQEYVQNPMLKHFSVPNIRIRDMELTIPVAVDATQTITREYTQREIQNVYEAAFFKVNADLFPNQTADQVAYLESIKPELAAKAVVYAEEAAASLRSATAADSIEAAPQADTETDLQTAFRTTEETTPIKETQEGYASESTPTNYTVAINKAAIKFAEVSYSFVGDNFVQESVFHNAMVAEIEKNLQPKSPEIEDLPVIVETQKLQEINDPANLIKIKVNITDNAMEWTTDVDENGNAVQVLNYE